jgi:glyoxylase-like metal-dependent hydrolase (beta-lactamase superfamily II)
LKTVLAVVALTAGAGSALAQKTTGVELTTTPVAPGISLIAGGPGGNILALTGEDGVLVVDAQDPDLAEKVRGAVAALGAGPARMVVNTHYHDDHLGANPLFRADGAITIAQSNVPALARVDTTITELDWHRRPAPVAALPLVTVRDSLTLHVDGEDVEIFHVDSAHTAGDLVVRFPKANVIHTGDVYEIGAYPFIDLWAGGTIDGLIASNDRILALCDAATRIVPGHGPVSDRAGLEAHRAMLATVRGRVAQALAEGKTAEETRDAGLTAEYDAARDGVRGGRRLVGIVYLDLQRHAGRP